MQSTLELLPISDMLQQEYSLNLALMEIWTITSGRIQHINV